MKKSSNTAPTLILNSLALTAMAVSAMGLAGCGKDPDAVRVDVYSTPEECVRAGGTISTCVEDDKAARTLHPQTAPRYAAKQDCEEDWGSERCETMTQPHSHGGGVVFINSYYPYYSPYYQGYMTGSYASSGSRFAAQPVYRNTQQAVFNAAGAAINPGSSYKAADLAAPARPNSFTAGTSASTTARANTPKASGGIKAGGFGSAGRAGGVSVGG